MMTEREKALEAALREIAVQCELVATMDVSVDAKRLAEDTATIARHALDATDAQEPVFVLRMFADGFYGIWDGQHCIAAHLQGAIEARRRLDMAYGVNGYTLHIEGENS